jgi:redox-sensitive bicupin YhaK (pirin superfamily)
MVRVRPAADRGATRTSWLDSRHTFSFNRYYDPNHMGFRNLRVINDDTVAPGGKFGRHPHDNMEIITYVLDGAVEHEDSTGARGLIRPGDAQRMSAGTGIYHSEANASREAPTHFYQIWIEPNRHNIRPGYDQKAFPAGDRHNRLRLIAAPDGRDGAITIHADADVYTGVLDTGVTASQPLVRGRAAWVQVAKGVVDVNGALLTAGDGAAVEADDSLRLTAEEPSELIVFDLA